MAEGYRLITTTYSYYVSKEAAIKAALEGRGEGKRTEVITEDHYIASYYGTNMQDLTKL